VNNHPHTEDIVAEPTTQTRGIMMFRLHKLFFYKLLPAVVFLCMLSILVKKAEEPLTLTAGQMFHHYVHTNTAMLQYAIISQGCSGSSATYQFVNDIFVARGMNNLFPLNKSEILKPPKNPFWTAALEDLFLPLDTEIDGQEYSQVIITAMSKLKSSAQNQKCDAITFKADPGLLAKNNVTTGLIELGFKFGHTFRSNVLDKIVCSIRDCFVGGEKFGHPVWANGTASHICFARRTLPSEKIKAYIDDIPALIREMRKQETKIETEIKAYSFVVYPGKSFSTEELFAYEYTSDQDVFVQSQNAHGHN
jgi:hypothetical protein